MTIEFYFKGNDGPVKGTVTENDPFNERIRGTFDYNGDKNIIEVSYNCIKFV